MRFSCKKCKAQYNIADDRVRGKVLKIRCKHCGKALIVRGPPEPTSKAAAHPPILKKEAEQEWHYGLDGEDNGPVALASLRSMIGSGEVSEEAFVWREGLDDWMPVEEVPELKDFLPSLRHQAEAPRPKQGKSPERRVVARKVEESDQGRQDVVAKIMRKRAAVRVDRHAGRIAEHFFDDGENLSDVGELMPTETAEDRAARETAERLNIESIDDEHALMQTDPEAIAARRAAEDRSSISVVIRQQAKVVSKGKRLGVALASVAAVLLLMVGLVVLAFQQDWVASPVNWFAGGDGSGQGMGGLGQLDSEDIGDSSGVRKSIWDVEKKRQAAAKNSGGRRHVGLLPSPSDLGLDKPVLNEQEKQLLAFYHQQADAKREVAPRNTVADLASPVGIDMGTGVSSLLDLPGMHGSKAEVAPVAPENLAKSNRLTEAQINFVIRRYKMQIKKCLDHQLKRDARISGKMLVGVIVKPSGKVGDVRIHTEKFRGTYLEECMLKRVKTWRFPAFTGEAYEVTFPLLLSAQESY